MGKYHEQFAGLRWVIEFKYYSNRDFRKFNTAIDAFEKQAEDTAQIAGYVEDLRQGISRSPNSSVRHLLFWQYGLFAFLRSNQAL